LQCQEGRENSRAAGKFRWVKGAWRGTQRGGAANISDE